MPILVTRCSNNYGPYQYPEKLIPKYISNIMHNKSLLVHADDLITKNWVYVYDHCNAIDLVLHKGEDGETYNISGDCEIKNLNIIKFILNQFDKPKFLIKFVENDLSKNGISQSINSSKIRRELGWKPKMSFEEGMKSTISWYLNNKEWTKNIYRKNSLLFNLNY